jgi:hypothetical protein
LDPHDARRVPVLENFSTAKFAASATYKFPEESMAIPFGRIEPPNDPQAFTKVYVSARTTVTAIDEESARRRKKTTALPLLWSITVRGRLGSFTLAPHRRGSYPLRAVTPYLLSLSASTTLRGSKRILPNHLSNIYP